MGRLSAPCLDEAAWEDDRHWQTADWRILKRINLLIDTRLREPFEGIGRPEQLKCGAQGEDPVILQARYHY